MSTLTATSRVASIYSGLLWVFPRVKEGEKLIVEWKGIRREWQDSTVMPWLNEAGEPDRDVTELVELYLAWKISLYDNNDQPLAASMRGLYLDKRADLIADCATNSRMNLTDVGVNECPR